MSPQTIALLVLVALALFTLFFRISRKSAVMIGDGETCPHCHVPFPPEMLEKVKQASAAQIQQTLQKFTGQRVNLKLKIKMTCPKCHCVAEIEVTPASIT